VFFSPLGWFYRFFVFLMRGVARWFSCSGLHFFSRAVSPFFSLGRGTFCSIVAPRVFPFIEIATLSSYPGGAGTKFSWAFHFFETDPACRPGTRTQKIQDFSRQAEPTSWPPLSPWFFCQNL